MLLYKFLTLSGHPFVMLLTFVNLFIDYDFNLCDGNKANIVFTTKVERVIVNLD